MMMGGWTAATKTDRRVTARTAITQPRKNPTVNPAPRSPLTESIATPVRDAATASSTAVQAGNPRNDGTTDLSSVGTRPLLRALTGGDSSPAVDGRENDRSAAAGWTWPRRAKDARRTRRPGRRGRAAAGARPRSRGGAGAGYRGPRRCGHRTRWPDGTGRARTGLGLGPRAGRPSSRP